ncbi:hypothetical protein C8J56DRAFT_1024726 [Mycena floridula]|nr:hypothetical protein C8J56DRAFT_1024726 [Mycena floridula]
MAPTTSTKAAANGAPKGKTPAPSTGTSTPVSEKKDTSEDASTAAATGKPDKKAYDEKQDKIKADIEALNKKLSAVRDKISLTTKSSPAKEKRTALKAEMDSLRGQQSGFKASQSDIHTKIKTLNEGIVKKIKDLQSSKSKMPYKNVAEVDAHIKNLEKQVESGSMKLAEEKRALQEISLCKRNRRAVESFEADQKAIDADRESLDSLKKQLDDPEYQAVQGRYTQLKAEMDALTKEEQEAYEGRSELFKQRDDIQQQINDLYAEKRDASQKYKEANDRYWTKIHEERAKRAERYAAQRAATEAQKKQERAEELLETAKVPAFLFDIEDCQTLIDHFLGKTKGEITLKKLAPPTDKEVPGVAKLDIRKVESAPQEGLVTRKKKGEDEESYFVGGKGKGKGRKGVEKTNGTAEASSASQLNVPFSTLSALLALSIPPPVSQADVPRVVADLTKKKDWFVANQARVSAENLAKAEAEVRKLSLDDSKSPAPAPAATENGDTPLKEQLADAVEEPVTVS